MTEDAFYAQLIEAVRQLAVKNAWDYSIAIAPILLSAIAIIISISVAHQQNKIALFDKRFEAFAEIQKCLAFERLLSNAKNPQIAYDAFCAAYGCNESIECLQHGWATQKYIPIERTLMQSCFLFNCIDENIISNVCKSLLSVLLKIETQQDLEKEKAQFKCATTELLRRFSKLCKQLK